MIDPPHRPTDDSAKARVYRMLEHPDPDEPVSMVVSLFIVALIIINVIALALETIASLHARWGAAFRAIEMLSVGVFTVEYVARVWSCTAVPRYAHPVRGRVRYALSFFALVDLIAILPFYIAPVTGDLRFMRAARLVRFVWIAKLGEHSTAVRTIARVVAMKRQELGATLFLAFVLVLLASSAMYYAENAAQPEAFASIPETMWWSIVTMTTVGYGDVYPITVPGRIIGAIIAISGILFFAIPTAILGSGFYAVWHQGHSGGDGDFCPTCGQRRPGRD